MKNLLPRALVLLASSLVLMSCQSTKPTAESMDAYYRKAEEMAQVQVGIIDVQLRRGVISQEEYDLRLGSIRNGISKQAMDLAWARHEIAEAQKRQLGIPTGDSQPEISVPSASSTGGFYRPAGTVGTNSLPTSSAWRGSSPASSSGNMGGRF